MADDKKYRDWLLKTERSPDQPIVTPIHRAAIKRVRAADDRRAAKLALQEQEFGDWLVGDARKRAAAAAPAMGKPGAMFNPEAARLLPPWRGEGVDKRRAARLRKFFNTPSDQEIPISKLRDAFASWRSWDNTDDFERQVFKDINSALSAHHSIEPWAREFDRKFYLGSEDAQGPTKRMMERSAPSRRITAGPEMFPSEAAARAYLKDIGVDPGKPGATRAR